jgi:GPI mannosyltransferase 3
MMRRIRNVIHNRRPLLVILLFGFCLRAAALLPMSMHHPDELFQYLEQAHRLVFGYGYIPWEYDVGMRSWVLPILLAGPMKVGTIVAPDSLLYLMLPRFASMLASMAIIWAAWRIGGLWSRTHAIVAAFVMAFWFEQVHFGTHILTEMLATACFLPAAALIYDPLSRRRAFYIAGLLLGFAFILRFHFAPAILVFVVLTSGLKFTDRYVPIIAGGLCVLMASAMVDLSMGQWPFGWLYENFRQNILKDRASDFGVSPPLAYVGMILVYWGWAAAPLMLAIVPALSRYRALFWTAIVNIAVLMLIGHKEYRFIFPSTTLLILLSAVGSAQLFLWIKGRYLSPKISRYALVGLVAAWAGSSAALALKQPMRSRWTALKPTLELYVEVGKNQMICGVALNGFPDWSSGGYTYLHRNIPIVSEGVEPLEKQPQSRQHLLDEMSYNAILVSDKNGKMTRHGYVRQACRGQSDRVCLYTRAGTCNSAQSSKRDWKLH